MYVIITSDLPQHLWDHELVSYGDDRQFSDTEPPAEIRSLKSTVGNALAIFLDWLIEKFLKVTTANLRW